MLVVPLVVRIRTGALDTVDYAVWVVFAVEYLVKLYLSPSRWEFIRHHPVDLLVIAVRYCAL